MRFKEAGVSVCQSASLSFLTSPSTTNREDVAKQTHIGLTTHLAHLTTLNTLTTLKMKIQSSILKYNVSNCK